MGDCPQCHGTGREYPYGHGNGECGCSFDCIQRCGGCDGTGETYVPDHDLNEEHYEVARASAAHIRALIDPDSGRIKNWED